MNTDRDAAHQARAGRPCYGKRNRDTGVPPVRATAANRVTRLCACSTAFIRVHLRLKQSRRVLAAALLVLLPAAAGARVVAADAIAFVDDGFGDRPAAGLA